MAQTFTSTDVVSTTNVFADNQSQRTNENTLRSTFSGSTQPSDPVVGQQWYDTSNSKTMQYNGTAWVPVDTNGTTQVDVSNAKGSLTSLTSYLRVAHNDDGTLKTTPASSIDEFKDNALVITYLSPTSFTVPSDLTSIFTANRKVKVYLSASTAISYVVSSTFSTVTTVTLGAAVLDATVTAVKFSIIQDGERQDTVHTSDIQQYLLNNIKRNTLYSVGDISCSINLKPYLRLECVSSGTTANIEPAWPTSAGIMISDGDAKWITDDIRDGTPVGRVVGDIMLRAGYVKANGATVNRADYPRLYNFATTYSQFYDDGTRVITGTATSGAISITGISASDIAKLSALSLPITISGTGIASGTKITAISTTSVTISTATTAAISAGSISYGNATNFPGLFGAGDGSTTMVLPNWRGAFSRYLDDGRGLDADGTARTAGSYQADAVEEFTASPTTSSGTRLYLGFATGSSSGGTYPGFGDTYRLRPWKLDGSKMISQGAETRSKNIGVMAVMRY